MWLTRSRGATPLNRRQPNFQPALTRAVASRSVDWQVRGRRVPRARWRSGSRRGPCLAGGTDCLIVLAALRRRKTGVAANLHGPGALKVAARRASPSCPPSRARRFPTCAMSLLLVGGVGRLAAVPAQCTRFWPKVQQSTGTRLLLLRCKRGRVALASTRFVNSSLLEAQYEKAHCGAAGHVWRVGALAPAALADPSFGPGGAAAARTTPTRTATRQDRPRTCLSASRPLGIHPPVLFVGGASPRYFMRERARRRPPARIGRSS